MKLRVLASGSSDLPPLYSAWMEDLLPGPISKETEATCDDCVMLSRERDRQSGSGYFFDPRTKCCTYVPELPNFLVGRILADEDPAFAKGRATLQERLEEGVAVTPLGIGRSPTFRLLYEHTAGVAGFGQNRALRCPHYLEEEGGKCGIWRHRKSTCATWFCKHVRGAVGMRFWKTVHQLLGAAEDGLARWCVLELEVGAEALRLLFPPPGGDPARPERPVEDGGLDGVASLETYRARWGSWTGRERAFYEECARRVSLLTWSEVAAICGPEIRIGERLVIEAYRELVATALPPALQVGPLKVGRVERDSSQVWTYSPIDPLDLPRAVTDVLHYFDGRPTEEAIRSIAEEEGIELDDTLVRKLVDFRILTACEAR